MTLYAVDFGASVADQSATNLSWLFSMMGKVPIESGWRWLFDKDQPHRFMLGKMALDTHNACWKETGFILECVVRSAVDENSAVRLDSV